MSGRPIRLVVVLLLALIVGVGVGAAGTAVTDVAQEDADDDLVADCAAPMPEDFADPEADNETIGWVDGYWYDEPLEIDSDDGLTEAELDALSARTAARFEALRCLSFEEIPEIEVVPREEFAAEQGAAFEDVQDHERTFDNAKLETLLLVGADEDSIDVREEERAAVVGGYYDFLEERIVVVSDDPDAAEIDEAILAHELGHALQDQHFDLEGYERPTTDADNGVLGMIEGDVHRIEHQYLERCEDDRWSEPCMTDDAVAGESEAAAEPPSWGLYFKGFQPYSDGPSFVEHVYEEGGWEAVNGVYEEMPSTSTHTIYPETYPEFEPAELSVEDESGDDWERVETPQGPDYDVIGQAGLSAILMDPAYDGTPIIPADAFLNMENGETDPTNPINYDHPETDGWEGDRLYVYGDDDERTGTVWKLAWESEEDAVEFADAYEQLIGIRGGEAVEDADRTYEYGEESEFEGAVDVTVDDDRLWIVTAPSIEELDEIHGDDTVVDAEAATDADDAADDTDDADDEDDAAIADDDGDDTDDADDTSETDGSDDTDDTDDAEDTDDTDDTDDTPGEADDTDDTDDADNTDDGDDADTPDEPAADEEGLDSDLALGVIGIVVLAGLAIGAFLFTRRR